MKVAFAALVAVAALGIALALGAPHATAVQVTLVASAAVADFAAALRARAALPGPAFLFERSSQRRRSMARKPPSPTLDALEWTLLFSAERELDLYGRLRPLLRDIASARRWSKIDAPVMSEGMRSGVNWTRESRRSATCAKARATSVFARPGRSSMRT